MEFLQTAIQGLKMDDFVHEKRILAVVELGFYDSQALARSPSMPLPQAGENVKVTLMSGETIEGSVEWIDGDGAMIKGAQKSRWVPLEAFQPQQPIDDSKDSE